MDNSITKQNYWLLSTCLFSFFLTWSFAFSLFPIWLKQAIGLTGEQTGLIFSINAISALFVGPVYGYLQDKFGIKKHLLFLVAFLLICTGPFMIYVYGPLLQSNFILGALLGGIFSAVTFGCAIGLLESYIERIGRLSGFEFGKVRMWGSIGWAVATFFAGKVFNSNPDLNFILASLTACIFIVSLIFVKTEVLQSMHDDEKSKSESVTIYDALNLLKLPDFWGLAVFVIGVTCVYAVYDQQFPIYFSSLFSTLERGNEMFGYLNAFQVFLEAGGMFLAPFLVNRIGAKNGLIISGIIMAVRVLGSGFAADPISISLLKLLHAVELPIMLVSIFKYIAFTFDKRLSATIYLVGFQFTTQVAASGLSILAGVMYDNLGFPTSYKIMGAVVTLFVILSWIVLKPTPIEKLSKEEVG
jgi:OHS family lactose permease-like MFS transporter